MRGLFDPNLVWHLPGHNHLSGDHVGVDNVLALFGRNFQETGGTFKVEAHDILGNDSHAVALSIVSGEKDGKRLNDRFTHVIHISNGKVTESWIFNENQDKTDEFWG